MSFGAHWTNVRCGLLVMDFFYRYDCQYMKQASCIRRLRFCFDLFSISLLVTFMCLKIHSYHRISSAAPAHCGRQVRNSKTLFFIWYRLWSQQIVALMRKSWFISVIVNDKSLINFWRFIHLQRHNVKKMTKIATTGDIHTISCLFLSCYSKI